MQAVLLVVVEFNSEFIGSGDVINCVTTFHKFIELKQFLLPLWCEKINNLELVNRRGKHLRYDGDIVLSFQEIHQSGDVSVRCESGFISLFG